MTRNLFPGAFQVSLRVLRPCPVRWLLLPTLLGWLGVPVASALGQNSFSDPLPAAVNESAAAHLARPSEKMYAWQEQERIMFLTFGIAAYTGGEYDRWGGYDLSKFNPEKFDARQLVAAAQSFGAREILIVAKHVGGFCLWPTATTPYNISKTPWRAGKGNLVKEIAEACRQHNLKVGIYIYPDDLRYNTGLGRGGKTDNPALQSEYDAIYQKQHEEVFKMCGPDLVNEVWFDGGCRIDIYPTINRYAPRAVIFNGGLLPDSLRWPGNEQGLVPCDNWNAIKSSEAKGAPVDDFAYLSHPDGDFWTPFESDTTLYDHYWFWSPAKEGARKSLVRLMQTFFSSVGNGSTLLLNASPNTDGLIPEGDLLRYKEFGEALDRNFGHPVAKTQTAVAGREVELELGTGKEINCLDIWEDYRLGQRIREYKVTGFDGKQWLPLGSGKAVGRRKLILFPTQTLQKVRLRILASVGTPVIRLFQVHRVEDRFTQSPENRNLAEYVPVTASDGFSRKDNNPGRICDGNIWTVWSAAAPTGWLEFDLGRPRKIARLGVREENGAKVEAFSLEGRNRPQDEWKTLCQGTNFGVSYDFERVTARYVRLSITRSKQNPSISELGLLDRPEAWERVQTVDGKQKLNIDLSTAINEAAMYEVRLMDKAGRPMILSKATLLFEGKASPENLSGLGTETLKLNRSQAVGPGTSSRLEVELSGDQAKAAGTVEIRPWVR
jgi:alpha-L-fucosidase